jgi:hypothetical protein
MRCHQRLRYGSVTDVSPDAEPLPWREPPSLDDKPSSGSLFERPVRSGPLAENDRQSPPAESVPHRDGGQLPHRDGGQLPPRRSEPLPWRFESQPQRGEPVRQRDDTLPPRSGQSLPQRDDTLPPRSGQSLPQRDDTLPQRRSEPLPQRSEPQRERGSEPAPQRAEPLPQRSETLPPRGSETLPLRTSEALPPRGGEPLPQHASPLPKRASEPMPQRSETLPQRSEPLPQRSEPLFSRGSELLPQRGSESLPQRGEPLPQRGSELLPPRGEQLPQRGEALPQRGEALPQRNEPLPQRGGALPARGGETLAQRNGALPRRTTRTKQAGRHRSPHRLSVAPDAPALILAVPGDGMTGTAAGDPLRVADQIAALAEISCPGVEIRVGFVSGDAHPLRDCLSFDTAPAGPHSLNGVIVPLLAGPHEAIDAAVSRAAGETEARVMVGAPLGPHPLLAEALHARLAEAGLARETRSRGLSISASTYGVLVLADRGEDAVKAAGVAAVLLASRLAMPAAPASIDDPAGIDWALARLREAGAQRPVIAPCLIGPETQRSELDAVSAAIGAPSSAPLGTHTAVGQLVAIRYGAALARLSMAG